MSRIASAKHPQTFNDSYKMVKLTAKIPEFTKVTYKSVWRTAIFDFIVPVDFGYYALKQKNITYVLLKS